MNQMILSQLEAILPEISSMGGWAWYFIAFAVIITFARVFSFWKVFKKAGEKGWKSLIPFYSDYTLYKIGWNGSMYWPALLYSFVTFVAGIASESAVGSGRVVVFVCLLIATIAMLCYEFRLSLGLSKAFGHGKPFALGLFFFQVPFMCILAVTKQEYKKTN